MFHLYCDRLNSRFTLTSEGENWKKAFDSFEDAYEHAESRATAEVPFIFYNHYGLVLFRTIMCPIEPELRKARAHWKELVAMHQFEETGRPAQSLLDAAV